MRLTPLTVAAALSVSLPLAACSSGSHDSGAHDSGTAGTDGGSTEGGGKFASIPNPAVLIANGGSGVVSIVDPATLKVVGSLPVMAGMHPHHVSVSPDKTRVLITATSADLSAGHSGTAHGGHGGAAASTMVYLLDVASRELRDVITVGATAHNAVFTRDGATIVLGMMEHGMIVGHDATTFAETFTADGFVMPLEVTPTGVGSLLVAESGASRVALFDLASHTTTTRFDVGAVPVAAWASGGSNYFVSVEEGMQVRHLVEGATNVTMDAHTIDLGGMPGQAVLTPNGSELWVAVEDRGVLEVFNTTTHEKVNEFAAGAKPHGITFDPSGARAFVTDEDGGKLLVVDVAAHRVSSEVALGGKPNGIAWIAR
jgi:YVTN family beta-propeller protein